MLEYTLYVFKNDFEVEKLSKYDTKEENKTWEMTEILKKKRKWGT